MTLAALQLPDVRDWPCLAGTWLEYSMDVVLLASTLNFCSVITRKKYFLFVVRDQSIGIRGPDALR